MAKELTIHLREPHEKQGFFIYSTAKRKVIRAGRRSGKTTGIGILAVEKFVSGHRVLYATPTQDQIDRFWHEVKLALAEPLEYGVYYKNETRHVIELLGTEQRIRAKTAWNADTLRGDYADVLILDEYQLMNEDAWGRVGAPMLLDNNGDAVFIYTPPSLHSRSTSKARDPRHASKLYKRAQEDKSGRWETFHFTSLDNPHLSRDALDDIADDMTRLAYQQEILAEDAEDAEGALWNRSDIDDNRVSKHPDLIRVVVGVDPPGGAVECGIIAAGIAKIGDVLHGYVLDDRSIQASPQDWGNAAVAAYYHNRADRIVAEVNFGGDMVEATIRIIDKDVAYKEVRASRGKAIRAEPVSALYEQGRIHHVGQFPYLEDELCMWVPMGSMPSPNRLDALVWALTDLIVGEQKEREGPWGF